MTAVIPLADAVLLNDRPCPGCPDCASLTERQLLDAIAAARQVLADGRPAPDGVEP